MLFLTVLILLTASLPVMAGESSRTFFPALHKTLSLPVDSRLGNTADYTSDEEHRILSQALSQEFSFEWTEAYLDESNRDEFLKSWTNSLKKILPASGFIMSKSLENADGSRSISVRIPDYDSIYNFVIINGKVLTMSEITSD
ncbi:MAG: hypothetical protein K5634_04230 [Sphaerochaetaceae bacterium]|nr:hypothetical protein [Sphaerochaetaceae bacterium]